ncbi:2Fe-2S iron-sulfur cluster-binding protein [Microbacterium sp.]|uniref:2Fe-2S iron-sulfur cluster-binding protein n=1 Tax=Microbacterium sp. TaxID=51671 RepID=UPI0039E3BAE8
MTSARLAAERAPGYGIDRSRPVSFVLDGTPYSGYAGDTIASACLAAGRIECGPSMYRGRPRGVFTAGVEEPNALVRVAPRFDGDIEESMLPATTTPITEGLAAAYLSGLGRLAPAADEATYDHKHVHTDVLIVGAGPAGIAAAREAAKTGARTILLDEHPSPGASLLGSRGGIIDGQDARSWVRAALNEAAEAPEFTYLARTTAVGSYDSNYVVAVQDRTHTVLADLVNASPRPGKPRQRVWHIRAGHVILATGSRERPIVFANNDRPGVMLAGAARTYLNCYGVAAGSAVAVATTNDSVYCLVDDLHDAGVEVVVVVDSRPEPTARAVATLARTGVRALFGSAIADTAGSASGRLGSVTVSALGPRGTLPEPTETIAADLLAVSGGFTPVTELHTQRQGTVMWSDRWAGFVPSAPVAGQFLAGAVTGDRSLDTALATGATAGNRAALGAGFTGRLVVPHTTAADDTAAPDRPVWLVAPEDTAPEGLHEHFVDLQRDQSAADVCRAVGAGLRSIEHVKRYTSISTASDQGKTSGVNTIGLVATLLAQPDPSLVGTTSHRPPYTPVAFAALAGRRRGDLFDPARLTAIHPWHVAQGAVFEDVGQWKRPRYYPRDGEDMSATVQRECLAVRHGVGFQDASTLGKIEVRGADAGEFLNRVYTNAFAKLEPGKARYGVMCTPDGMIFDDGVTLRIAEDRFFLTTTTGGAARVLDWLEEWHQTEWPHLDVFFTSVTDQWSTIAIAGPRSRDVVAKIAPGLDVSAQGFGFMEFRETTLADGIPARLCRISFSGELAFEVNVDAFYGLEVWKLVADAGAEFDITPYGTEAMHVLRAEKGFIIVGQDTDGTVTPQDAGMGWVVSKVKDFIGKRSYQRADTARPDRKHLVGVVPVDRATLVREGAQLVASGTPITPQLGPVPTIGHVTSSYYSASLGHPFGLALVHDGRNRIGEIVQAFAGEIVDVEITEPVWYDPEGIRRDG